MAEVIERRTDARRRRKAERPQEIIEAVNDAIKDKHVIVSTGVGQHQVWVPRHFDFSTPERMLLTSSGHGTMGYDIPAAIGAKTGP